MNDYVHIPYANGSSFASQFLFREFEKRDHAVTVVGPDDPNARPEDLPSRHVLLPSLPLRNHPGVYIPLPSRKSFREVEARGFDIVLGQSTTELLDLGVWLRWRQNIPFLCVNTVHLPSVYNVVLPDSLNDNPTVNAFFRERCIPWLERHTADVYNKTDGLIVLSEGLKEYWQERGVRVPIFVIPRAIEPRLFDAPAGSDPFNSRAAKGARLLCVCRHTREKGVKRLIEIFAHFILPAMPEATLTLVGDGPDHDDFRRVAERLGVSHRTYFPGEQSQTQIVNWYKHADLFVYTSLSETYGQVVSEAMWCGLPVVALEDRMGVSHQMRHGLTGALVPSQGDSERENWRFAQEVVSLLRDADRRRACASSARANARERSEPSASMARYYAAFDEARRHCNDTFHERQHSPLQRVAPIARWVSVHTAVLGLGLLRPPAIVNRHGRKPPSWTLSELPIAAGRHSERRSAEARRSTILGDAAGA